MQSENQWIQLAGYRFDPLTGAPDLPDDLRAKASPDAEVHYLVQFHTSPDREARQRLQRRYRLSLMYYIPIFAYLERLTPATLDALRKDPLFRAAVRYEPAYKLSPTLGQTKFRTERRQAQEGLWLWVVLFPDEAPDEVARQVEEAGGKVGAVLDDRKLQGMVRLRVQVPDASVLPAIAQLEAVQWIEEIGEIIEDNVNAATTIQSGTAGTGTIWNQSLTGQGQVIGMIDSGPPDINHCFFMDTTNNTPNLAHRKVLAIRNANGDAAGGHATFVAGCAAGDDVNNPGTHARRGGAWAARLVAGNNADLDVFGGSATLLSELNAAAGMTAFIHTNSWHENSVNSSNQANYTQRSVDVDTFTWNNEDHLVLGSAGNTGEEQGAPGTAKNAICVSAAQADPNENNLGDGNPGPTADGRRKPDLVTVGCSIQSATVATGCTVGPRSACATSYATPHAAAAAALVRQYYTEGWYPTGTQQAHQSFIPSGALLKATLLNSTRNMTGTGVGNIPDPNQGWGLVRLDDTLYFDGGPLNLRVWDVRNADGLLTGETRTHHIDVASNAQRLKVTLVWTEPPSAASTTTPLVNTLNLQVISPGGTQTFLGNQFAGGVSTTGGTANTTDNVEMVLINTPATGDWTINVIGTAVNVGNPGQGYALVVTADMPEAPATTGVQDTLVVRVKFADVAFVPPLPGLQNTMLEVADYVDEVSYGQATVNPLYRGPIQLDHPKSYYYHPERNLLIELTEEVVAKLVTAEPNIFDNGTPNDIDRMVIVTNDSSFSGDWATTGPWPYELPGGLTKPISVSVQSYNNPSARFTHGMLHHFGLVDLYAHPGVVFPRPYVDEWDNMADLFTNVHPLVWSKERAGWVTSHGSTITYIPRPAAGSSYTGTNPIPLFLQESTATNRKAIALGLTEGAATLAQENAFYFVEARSHTLGGFDDNLPASGVLIYYVNELIPQGQGPVIVRDQDLTTTSLADAYLTVGDTHTIPGTGITLTVLAGTGGAAYNIQVAYTPPVTDYNVRITRGDTINGQFYSYFSPDIWIDSPKNGFNLSAGPPPHEDRDNPVIGELNRIYARITNDGPATAFDFDVRFRISEPYHTVGGVADFDTFVGIAHIDSLPPGSTNVYVDWTPEPGNPHACVLVDIINLVGTDTNPNDHEAQENLQKVTSVTSSPFHPVTYRYDLTNPYDEPTLFYFRAQGAPRDWKVELNPRKILLNPGEHILGQATVTPPPDGKYCTSELIQITSWAPRGDTLIPVGGGVVQVDLRRPTAITLETDTGRCDGKDLERLLEEAKKSGKPINPEELRKLCRRISVKGCTIPPLPNQEIIVKFTDPAGNVVYHTVKTDENGCYEDFLVTAEDGIWQVEVEYEGGKCEGPATGGPRFVCMCR
ncbi:M6 family metalloprotease domain-containing protein [Catalinimonas alkaloidigena]|uniref:M6 family metalloprotease domain-containing protein n=1 Tax=Catalinimonas alkaloidigena TaxID=1075417 RepID=A0A1G8YJH6_9BACT|nr:S8 family serine peptidase [Catalinimonas alkaloidigena]SDK02250.1 M6 family metalloprotease domain-containing protein [Catalinimonas alkaloidigena]